MLLDDKYLVNIFWNTSEVNEGEQPIRLYYINLDETDIDLEIDFENNKVKVYNSMLENNVYDLILLNGEPCSFIMSLEDLEKIIYVPDGKTLEQHISWEIEHHNIRQIREE